jgi:hypothetical protein
MKHLVLFALLAGCAAEVADGEVAIDPDETQDATEKADAATAAMPDVRCTGTPAAANGSFRHVSSRLVSALGSPKHRGVDLLVRSTASSQVLLGDVSYTIADKALEDEDVDVFACRAGAWKKLGRARSNGEGHFKLTLTSTQRLPIGVRDMYLSVVGDGTGTRFVAVVAPADQRVIVTDVDGTLTSDENAFTLAQVSGDTVGKQAGAPAALAAAGTKGLLVVYLTARGRQYTGATRAWLAANGFPRGVLRLADSFVTLPGDATVAYKTKSLAALGFDIAGAIGNRASDVEAYGAAGIPATRTFVKLPEFSDELADDLAAHRAIGFPTYDVLRMQYVPTL